MHVFGSGIFLASLFSADGYSVWHCWRQQSVDFTSVIGRLVDISHHGQWCTTAIIWVVGQRNQGTDGSDAIISTAAVTPAFSAAFGAIKAPPAFSSGALAPLVTSSAVPVMSAAQPSLTFVFGCPVSSAAVHRSFFFHDIS